MNKKKRINLRVLENSQKEFIYAPEYNKPIPLL